VWNKLHEINKSVVNNKRTVVPSGHGVGKSWNVARLALWFLFCHYPAKVVTTAPTWPQVEKILWSEIGKAYNSTAVPLGGRLLTTELKIEKDWFAIGLSPKEDVASKEFGVAKFQGYHSPNLLILLDEGAGVRASTYITAESLISSENNKIVAIGNPESSSGYFYDKSRSPLWNKVHISCFDHPNVKENKIIIPGAVTRQWIDDRRTEWGEGSPLWQAKVLGDFPDEGDDTLFPLSWVERSMRLNLEAKGKKKLGADIARFGNDKTVFYTIIGNKVTEWQEFSKIDTMETAGRIMQKHHKVKYDSIGVDDTGLGGGVSDRLLELDIPVEKMIFGAKATDSDRFFNKRAEVYWILRERLDPKFKDPLQIPDDPELRYQLTSIKFKYSSRGIQIETKDDMKKRGLKSPDKADALAIANYAGINQLSESPISFL